MTSSSDAVAAKLVRQRCTSAAQTATPTASGAKATSWTSNQIASWTPPNSR